MSTFVLPYAFWHDQLAPAAHPHILHPLVVLSLHRDYLFFAPGWMGLKARDDGLVTVDMGPPELNGPKVPSTLPTNADGVVLKEPIQVRALPCACTNVHTILGTWKIWWTKRAMQRNLKQQEQLPILGRPELCFRSNEPPYVPTVSSLS